MLSPDQFTFWRVMPDGTAEATQDDADVNANPKGVYGNIEGAIINGGVRATAFTLKTEDTYDAKAWLETGAMVPAGKLTTLTIIAERE